MAPIVSAKLLNQIMMQGCATELSRATYAIAVCQPTVLALGSVIPRRRRALAGYSDKASYASLPNSTFIINTEGTHSEAGLTSEGYLIPKATLISTKDLEGVLANLPQETPESTDSLEVYPESGSIPTCVSNTSSTVHLTSSMTSCCEPPSTAATSIPPWDASKHFEDPLKTFGAPPATSYARISSPVDSLDIIRHRRLGGVTGAELSSVFIPRSRKYGDVRGLKRLGLRGLEIFKKVKW